MAVMRGGARRGLPTGLAAAVALAAPAWATPAPSGFGDVVEAWRGKVVDFDITSAWQACGSELAGRVYTTADRDTAAARCASAAISACAAKRRPSDPPSLAFCLDGEVKPAAAAAVAAAPPVDISRISVADAKAEVARRLVPQASILNGAHGPKVADDRVVCQRTPVIGSNIPGPPVCATKKEWRERAADTQAFVAGYEQRVAAFGVDGGH